MKRRKKRKYQKKIKKVKKRKRKERKYIYALITVVIICIIFLTSYKTKIEDTDRSMEQVKITITSPLNKTYDTGEIELCVYVNKIMNEISNSFDKGRIIKECGNCNGYCRYDLVFEQGTHTIKAYAKYNDRIITESVTFTVYP